jgi:hypothetical protein|tara:strand:- start:6423 stop:6764 length:342 start_codon:yes stop_codon:yes gene_type:complete
MTKAKVYVVQENPNYSVLNAGQYGELEVLLPYGSQIVLSVAPTLHLIRKKLRNYCDEDYIVAIGDPTAIAIACMVAGEVNRGLVNMLKWDKREKMYYPIQIDLNGRKEKEKNA